MDSCLLDSSPNHSPAARLAHFMSEVSEACLCAGWHRGAGPALWRMVHEEGPSECVQGEVSTADKRHLIELAREAGGWCVYAGSDLGDLVPGDGVVLVPWPEWAAICERVGLPVGLPGGTLRTQTLYRICNEDRKHEPPFCYRYETRLDAELAAFAWLWENAEELLTLPSIVAGKLRGGVERDMLRVRLLEGARPQLTCHRSRYDEWYPTIRCRAEFMKLRKVRRPKTEVVHGVEVTTTCEAIETEIPWTNVWGGHAYYVSDREAPVIVHANVRIEPVQILYPPSPGTPRWFICGGNAEQDVEPPEDEHTSAALVKVRPYRDGSGYSLDAWLQAVSQAQALAAITERAPGFQSLWAREIPPHRLPKEIRP